MNSVWSILIPALIGLLAGILGSLVAPWVNWGIEKKREKLKYRREIIQRCRAKIDDANFTKQSFRNTLEYKYIRPYLSPSEIEGMERDLTMMIGRLVRILGILTGKF